MSKEILKRYDELIEGFKQMGSHAWEAYAKGIFVESLVYTICGLLLLCVGLVMIVLAWKLYHKVGYAIFPQTEISAMTGEVKRVEDFKTRDKDKENVYQCISFFLGLFAPVVIFAACIFIYSNLTGVFAPEYVAIQRIIENVGEK